MTNKQVAESFASGGRQVRTANLFISGNTIYSYGYHFPIARLGKKGEAYLTTRGYSVTMTRHKNLVKQALLDRNWKLIMTTNVEY